MQRLNLNKGILLTGSSVGIIKFVAFATNILLARLLLPSDFGLITMAITVSEVISLLGNLGIGTALIYHEDKSGEYANAAFWLNLVVNILLTIIQIAVSGWAATFYKSPLLNQVLGIYALGNLINAIGNIHNALLVKNLKFASIAKISVISASINAFFSIGLALLGLRAWAILLGRISAQIITTIMNWRLSKWKPSGVANITFYRGLVSYGWKMFIGDGLSYLNHNTDYLVVGRQLGATNLGLYTFAYNLAMLPVTTITLVIGNVMYPIFSRLQKQKEDLQNAFTTAMRLSSIAGFPLSIGMIILANELILILFGSNWLGAIKPLQFLAIYGMGRCVSSHGGLVMNAIGRPDIPMKFNLIYTPIMVISLIVSVRWNILGVAVATALISGIATWIYLIVTLKIMNCPIRLVYIAIGPALVSSCVMGIGVFLVHQFLSRNQINSITMFILLIPFGAILYLVVLSMFYPGMLQKKRWLVLIHESIKISD